MARALLVIRGMRLNRGVAWTVGGGLVMLTWLLVSAGGTDLASGQPARGKAAKAAVVDHVADGDTIQVEIRGREEDVRFIGIDTPEVYGGVECGGREASASMKRMLKPGDRVRLVRDRSQDNRDYYGRLLRYVELRGRDLGRKQIRKGWASVYIFDQRFRRLGSYRRAQRKARSLNRGAWRECDGFDRAAVDLSQAVMTTKANAMAAELERRQQGHSGTFSDGASGTRTRDVLIRSGEASCDAGTRAAVTGRGRPRYQGSPRTGWVPPTTVNSPGPTGWPHAAHTVTGWNSTPQVCLNTTGSVPGAHCRSPHSFSASTIGRSCSPASVS